MRPKVSVIVPVHNAGDFLKRCLDSLVNQTLKEIEIILVIDCPTDGSNFVAEGYAKNDARIHLIYNESNQHIGFSRNIGLQFANGEYVGFMDHDDYCELNMFERLFDRAKSSDADVVISNYFVVNGEKVEEYGFPVVPSETFGAELLKATIQGHYSTSYCSFNNVNPIWIEIVKNELIVRNCVKFIDNRVLPFEDVLFNLDVYFFAKKIEYLPEAFYYHVITGSNNFKSYSYCSSEKIIRFLDYQYRSLADKGIDDRFRTEFSECVLFRLYSSFLHEVHHKGILTSLQFISVIRNNRNIQNYLSGIKRNNHFLVTLPNTKRLFYWLVRR